VLTVANAAMYLRTATCHVTVCMLHTCDSISARITGVMGNLPHCGCGPPHNTRHRSLGAVTTLLFLSSTTEWHQRSGANGATPLPSGFLWWASDTS